MLVTHTPTFLFLQHLCVIIVYFLHGRIDYIYLFRSLLEFRTNLSSIHIKFFPVIIFLIFFNLDDFQDSGLSLKKEKAAEKSKTKTKKEETKSKTTEPASLKRKQR